MSEFLSQLELRELTGRAQRDGQAEVLRSLGLPYLVVGKRLIVLRRHVVARIEGRPVQSGTVNMAAVR